MKTCLCALAWCAAGAAAQVQPDDHAGLGFGVAGVGVTEGRFDHRSPREPDVDWYVFQGTPGRNYLIELRMDEHAEAGGWVPSYVARPAGMLEGVEWEVTLSFNQARRVIDPRWPIALGVVGWARTDGTSNPYRLEVRDLGPVVDDIASEDRATWPRLTPGQWVEASLSLVWNNGDVDRFVMAARAGVRYRVEVEDLDGFGWVRGEMGSYADVPDPRLAHWPLGGFDVSVSGRVFDSVLDGDVVVDVSGVLNGWEHAHQYRVRVVEDGPAREDDHPDSPYGATRMSVGAPVSVSAGSAAELQQEWTSFADQDWLTIALQAGRTYRLVTERPAGEPAWMDAAWRLWRQDQLDGWSAPPSLSGDFQVPADGDYYLQATTQRGAVHFVATVVEVPPGVQPVRAEPWPALDEPVLEAGRSYEGPGGSGAERVVFKVDLAAAAVYRFSGPATVQREGSELAVRVEESFTPAVGGRYRVTLDGAPERVSFVVMGNPGDDVPADGAPVKISAGESRAGHIDAWDDSDTYRAVFDDDGLYAIELESPWQTRLYAEVYAGAGSYRWLNLSGPWNWVAGVTPPARGYLPVQTRQGGANAGRIIVMNNSGPFPAPYTVRVASFVPFRGPFAGGPTREQATLVEVGQTVGGERLRFDSVGWYRFNVRAGRLYAVEWKQSLTSAELPARLYDESGRSVCDFGDRWVPDHDGTVYLRVAWDGDSDWSWYTFTVRDLGARVDDAPATNWAAPSAPLGGEVTGRFDYPGDVDVYRLPLEADRPYRARLDLVEGPLTDFRWIDGAIIGESHDRQAFGARLIPGVATTLNAYGSINHGPLALAVRLTDEWFDRPDGARGYRLRVWAPCEGDLAGAGGALGDDGLMDVNDLVAFIELFFRQDLRADVGGPGGDAWPDGVWDTNDLVVYIDRFFAGC